MLYRNFRRAPGLLFHLLFIGIVSVYDAWLVVAWSDEILSNERNLVGRYLIQVAEGDVTLFVMCKLAGTAGALGILVWLIRNYLHIALPVARSMSIFQLWLLWFLTFSVTVDPLMPMMTGAAAVGIVVTCLWPYLSTEFDFSARRMKLMMTRLRSRRRRAQRKAQLAVGS